MASRVAIVTLNWNGLEDTRACLRSLEKTTYNCFDIVVVDNGSRQNEADVIEREFGSRIELVRLPDNLGFSGGNNVAIRSILERSQHDFVVTLNNDTTVESGWLDALVAAANSRESPGMVAAKMRFMSRPRVLNSTGFRILRDGTAIDRGRQEVDHGQYDNQVDVFGPSAGAALYRADLLREVGLFDEDFFAYFEDVDLAWRARLAGWTATFAPESVVYHKYSASSGAFSKFKVYQGERNRIWLLMKNYPLGMQIVAPAYNAAKQILLLRASLSGKGRGAEYRRNSGLWQILRTLQKAQVDAFVGAPKMFRKRREVYARAKVEPSEIRDWFRRYSVRLVDAPYL